MAKRKRETTKNKSNADRPTIEQARIFWDRLKDIQAELIEKRWDDILLEQVGKVLEKLERDYPTLSQVSGGCTK